MIGSANMIPMFSVLNDKTVTFAQEIQREIKRIHDTYYLGHFKHNSLHYFHRMISGGPNLVVLAKSVSVSTGEN